MTPTAQRGPTIHLVSDPGVPTRRVNAILEDLDTALQERFDPPVALHTSTDLVRLTPEFELDLRTADDIARGDDEIDMTILLTEVPRHSRGHPLIAEVFVEQRIAVISCPTFGAWATKKRILRTLIDAITAMPDAETRAEDLPRGFRWSSWSYREEMGSFVLHADTFTGGPRLVLGMIMANEPWKAVSRLSGALATAGAAGAFGVFYNSIWQMADYLSPLRLVGIGIVAVLAMVGWLMFSNRLWDRPRRESLAAVVMLYNLSTVSTLLLCVATLYLSLVALILLGALAIIDPDFMTLILGRESGFADYLNIAWLSAAMGLIAGAMGSSFDADADIRKLTHGQRERQRIFTEEEADDSATTESEDR